MPTTGANGTPGWRPPTRSISDPAQRHHMSDAHLATEAAVHGHGVALGDTVTARGLLAKGQLVTPFNLSVPAVDAFYVACRNEMRSAPIAQVFIDWLFAEQLESGGRAEAPVAGQISIRKRRSSKPARHQVQA